MDWNTIDIINEKCRSSSSKAKFTTITNGCYTGRYREIYEMILNECIPYSAYTRLQPVQMVELIDRITLFVITLTELLPDENRWEEFVKWYMKQNIRDYYENEGHIVKWDKDFYEEQKKYIMGMRAKSPDKKKKRGPKRKPIKELKSPYHRRYNDAKRKKEKELKKLEREKNKTKKRTNVREININEDDN